MRCATRYHARTITVPTAKSAFTPSRQSRQIML